MTDRIRCLTVALIDDYRDDDVQHIIDAIMMLRGVAAVVPTVTDARDYTNRETVRRELLDKLREVLR